ncbi:serine/threonine-protein kinase Nek10 isoform X1 [Scleropages formosus]|uniref:serine/threonine-protein kinase Nek10 isoform X1 n=1 Tax=Scleropages formosus TaxID=113540 RepID=UPI000878E98B|nr:serine/threonine-protein kinase Nek10 isoform X1 [Scleropages formosus]
MHMELVCNEYLEGEEQAFAVEKLVNMTYVFQKLSATEEQRPWVVECGAHKTLVKLLATRDSSVLLGALLALTSLAESPDCKEKIGELAVVGNLLVVLQEYDLLSKQVCAELLRLLCPSRQVREQMRALDGVPVLLSLLHSDHLQLLWSATWVLVQLCEDPEAAAEIRLWGGPQQLLRILRSERAFISARTSVETLSSANAAGRVHKQHLAEELSPQETLENTLSLQAACCAALTELILDDATAHQVVQENGVHIIGKLILPHDAQPGPKAKSLQCYAFRTLRFLFSMERNRPLFKRLFSADMFAAFIDIGHYVRDIAAYEALQEKVSALSEEELSSLRENIARMSLDRSPLKVVNGYAILDHLGSGAFGSVFKVRKQAGQNLVALKEVNLHNPAFGKDKKDREVNVEKIVSELSIIKEQINHPNIVRYYKTFLENDRLYIVMELIEGVPMAEHFHSLKEKQQQFTEERVWNIFIQLCLALRYLHKDKRIIHRDLTPNNIMLGEKDKVTITDFGLAKQKEENSKLTSVVGTILYSCPEIVKSEPYGEKADVWALGCILYHMAMLRPPFYSTNMLSLATKIVEAIYEPLTEEAFSGRVADIVKWCLTPDADLRPDIVEVSSRISDLMMRFMDSLCTSQHTLERKLERDRKRAQKYFLEANCGGINCRRPSLSQEESKRGTSVRTDGSMELKRDSSDTHHLSGQDVQESSHQKCTHGSGKGTGCGADVDTSRLDSTGSCKDLSMRTVKHSVSATLTEEQNYPCEDVAVPKIKPRPASAGICVSQRKVREIDDPVQRLLQLLHKIIYISQLPPTLDQNLRRRAIERFKKSLFDYRSSPYNLKVELNKLLQTSPEVIEQISVDRWTPLQSFGGKQLCATAQDFLSGDMQYLNLQEGITYEQMLAMIEEELEDNGYYNTLSNKEAFLKQSDHHP